VILKAASEVFQMICVHEIGIGLDERYQIANGVTISIELEKCNKIINLGVDLIIRHIYLLLANGFDDKLHTIGGEAIEETGVILIFLDHKGIQIGLGVFDSSVIGVKDPHDVIGVDI
jgi:hypothetical protein